jgi:hypothetical protein
MVMQARVEVMRNEHNIPFGKVGDDRPLGRSKLRWKDNIKINLNKMKCQNVKFNCTTILSNGGLLKILS